MSNSWFKFKQFTVFHDQCAMKVGTDGVLLGSWVNVSHATSILDVGTGCGLIALMLAQRNPCADIVAIDIDASAAAQAKENAAASPFHDKIRVVASSLQQYVDLAPNRAAGFNLYDLIVSNPPFFSKSLLPANPKRSEARHSVTLTLEELLRIAADLLSQKGVLAMVLPYDKKEELHRLCTAYHYGITRITTVYPLAGADPKRLLVELSLQPEGVPEEKELTIEIARHCYTDEFNLLTRDFYLNR